MSNNPVAVVFKVIIISALTMCIVGTGVNLYLAFNTVTQINAVGNAMKTEMSRNNSILDTSMMTGNTGNFASQLAEITSTSGSALRVSGDTREDNPIAYKQFILKAVYVMPTSETTLKDEYCILNTNQSVNKYDLNTDGSIDTTNWKTSGSVVGNYGEFYKIVFVYDVAIDILSLASTEEIKGGTADADSSVSIKGATFVSEQQFSYTVPCLRYIK